MSQWAYQFERDGKTYYTPMEAGSPEELVTKIIDVQGRSFTGYVWGVTANTVFDPPKPGMKCFRVTATTCEEAVYPP